MDVRNYALVTAAYWGFTLTDGALRMLVLLHFHELGYTPVNLAFLFLLYEVFGILTNLFGGWIGSRLGLRVTLFAGLATQIVALLLLSAVSPAWAGWLSVGYVMSAQALSGIAKDLTKMSSKSAVKLVVSGESQSLLFKWVALLTGSKNALKGMGFFLGGLLLGTVGFRPALWIMAGALALVLASSAASLRQDLGKSKERVKFRQIFSKTSEINVLSAARLFLFASRDVWFVVGLPIFLKDTLGWSFEGVGAFLAAWIIGYGIVQASAPRLLGGTAGAEMAARSAQRWGFVLAGVSGLMALALSVNWHPSVAVLGGLSLFAVTFAINSAVHSYLILAYTDSDKVALNVGFYYMANACGRLLGTLLSGVMYLVSGLEGCLWTAAFLALLATLFTFGLTTRKAEPAAADAVRT
jgi:predicted MFS family arabinose efflux permease